MGNIKQNHKYILWNIFIFLCWLPCIAYTVGLYKLVSIGIYSSVVLFSLYFILTYNYKKIDKFELFLAFFFILVLILTIIKLKFIDFYVIKDVIYFLLIILMFSLIFNQKIDNRMKNILYDIPTYISYLMLLFSVFPFSYDNNLYKNALYLKFQNPNILSYVLLIMLIFSTLGFLDYKKKKYIFAILIDLFLIVLTHSRTSLLASLVFIGLLIFDSKKYKYKINKIFTIFISLSPVVLCIIFILFNGNSFELFGKSGVSGRDFIWSKIFETIKISKSFMMLGRGSYMANYLDKEFIDAHNAYLQIICNFGIIIFLVFIIAIVFINIKCGQKIRSKYTFAAYWGTFAILLNCSFETHIVDAFIGMTFMWIALYWILLSEGDSCNDNISKTINGKTAINKK